MRLLIQKCSKASVEANGKTNGKIGKGLVVLLGIHNSDTEKEIDYLVEKLINVRLFEDKENKEKYFEKSIIEEGLEILIISQFTLYASCKKGRRPDFVEAAKSEKAKPLYEKFIEKLKEKKVKVESGVFGAEMKVNLINEGPVTIIIDSQ